MTRGVDPYGFLGFVRYFLQARIVLWFFLLAIHIVVGFIVPLSTFNLKIKILSPLVDVGYLVAELHKSFCVFWSLV